MRVLYLLPILAFLMICLGYCYFPLKFVPEINNASRTYSLNPVMITSVIKQESAFDPLAQSSSNAFGLMQLLPETALWIEESLPIVGSWREPGNNIYLGSFYVAYLRNLFGANIEIVLTAYNRGPGNVKKQIEENTFRSDAYAKKIQLYYFAYFFLYESVFEGKHPFWPSV